MASLARVIFLAFGIFLLLMAIVSGVYSYFYFQDHLQSPGGPLVIFEVTMICTVLGLVGGVAIGTYVEARRANKGQQSPPP